VTTLLAVTCCTKYMLHDVRSCGELFAGIDSFVHTDCLHGLLPGLFVLSYSAFVFSFFYFFVSVPYNAMQCNDDYGHRR